MSTRAPPGGSKRTRVKEFVHNALHKLNKIRTVFALWSRDPRSRRFSNLGLGPSQRGIWEHLEVALRALEISTRAFPPLHAFARACLDCVEIFEADAANDAIYESIAGEIRIMATTLSRHATELGTEPANDGLTEMANAIESSIKDCAARIKQLRERGARGQQFGSARDREELAKSYAQIKSLSRQLITLVNDQILHKVGKKSEDDRLKELGQVEEARYNSGIAAELGRRSCTPGTRTDVLDNIYAWATEPAGSNFLWVEGSAGIGKTTIARSACKQLEAKDMLGAACFCGQTQSKPGSLSWLIPSIAQQLAYSMPAIFRSSLCKVLEELPDSPSLEPHLQYQRLLLRPLQETKEYVSKHKVVVIDGLDECTNKSSIKEVLKQLLRLPGDLHIRFCITSRPERVIYNSLSAAGFASTAIHLNDIDPSIVKTDIKKYIEESLKGMLPPVTPEQIEKLAILSGNLFIIAATAVAYIRPDHEEGDPSTRLKAVLNVGLETSSTEVYELLYSLYSTVLDQAQNNNLYEEELNDLQLVLWTVICIKESMTIKMLAEFIGIEEDHVRRCLSSLHSVLHVSEGDGRITVVHSSFYEFIRNPPRPTVLHCNEILHSRFLAKRCFEIMLSQLKFNICRLESSFVADCDVPGLETRVDKSVSPELFYACQHWGYHLQQMALSELEEIGDPLETMLSGFLSQRLLYWMEVLNLRGYMEVGSTMLSSTWSWLLENNIWPSTQRNLMDARSFFTRFATNSCSRSTPHLYISALSSCPKSSSVYRNYWPLTRRLLNITGSAMNREQDAELSQWPVGARVTALSCSSDGANVASGCSDGTIRLLNIHAGTTAGQPIRGHNGSVSSIEFSRDGTRLASGSLDHTILLYDTTTTSPLIIRRLTGHEGPVSALSFASDGRRIATGSSDGIIRVWNVETGEPIGKLLANELECISITFSSDDRHIVAMGARAPTAGARKLDAGPVLSMNLSPDGVYLVTAGGDYQIRLWRADTGASIGEPFEGHTGAVLVVKFSSDGTHLISGSADRTVRVWDIRTGSSTSQPFEGHSGEVRAIAIVSRSPWVVSGSEDATIRLWNADTVLPPRPHFGAHSASVYSVTFSANSDFFLSSSDDRSVRMWEVRTGTLMDHIIVENGGSVLSVACSPDNRRYAATARNGTLLVGNIGPGHQLGVPTIGVGHQGAVLSVAFSDDGSHLVTGSYDRTIRTWDQGTLSAIGGQFKQDKTVTDVAMARRGNEHLVVFASGDKTVRLYNLETSTLINPIFSGQDSTVLSVAASPNADRIISSYFDNTIRVWDGYTGEMILPPITKHTGPVQSVALFQSPDGTQIIASGSSDKTVRLWDASTGASLGPAWEGHGGAVLSVCFSPDGKYVASGCANAEVRLWDIKSRWSPDTNGRSGSDGSGQLSRGDYSSGTGSWAFEDDGWVTDRGRLLFWMPQTHHSHMKHFFKSSHPCSLILSNGVSYGVESWDLALGEEWDSCFNVDYNRLQTL